MTTQDETHVNININYLEDQLDGVTWNGNGEDKREFPLAFTEVLRTVGLTGRTKLIIRQRFLNLYNHYNKKYKTTNFLHNSSRIIITVGSIIIPALLTLDNEISERSQSSQIIYYTTFSISLVVTLTNALTELMQISKKFYNYATTRENLKTEGWLFLSLSGKYKDYSDHTECWRKFVNKVEKFNTQATSAELILATHRQEDYTSSTPRIALSQLGIEQATNNDIPVESNVIYSHH